MTAGGYPTVQVLLDDGTGTFPYDITSYLREFDGLTGNRGRQDELAEINPGGCVLTFDNTTGAFTYGSTVIASPSPILIDRQIRVKVTANAVTVTRYTGYIVADPVDWPTGGDQYAAVKVTLVDAQAWAERRILRSFIEEEILATGPDAYYKLDESAGSTSAADSSGNQRPVLTITGTGSAMAFGTASGVAVMPSTVATFTNGTYLSTSQYPGPVAYPLGMVLRRTGLPAATETVWSGYGCEMLLDTNGKLNVYRLGVFELRTAGSICDGSFHTVLLSGHVGAGSLAVDGATVGTWASLGISLTYPQTLTVGGGGSVGVNELAGDICQVSLGTVASVASITTGFAGESGVARLTRLAGYGGIALGTMDASLTNVPYVDIIGKTLASAILEIADAEMGLAYINGSGALTFHNRNRAPAKTTPDFTINANFAEEGTHYDYDTSGIVNYFETTASQTGLAQIVWDKVSESGGGGKPAHGRYDASKTYLVFTDAEALSRGNFVVKNHAQPLPRVGSLKFDLLTMTAVDQAAALTLESGSWIQVQTMPSQSHGGTTSDVVVEGFAETLNRNEWTLTLNVVARSIYAAWILNDTTYSVLNVTTRLWV